MKAAAAGIICSVMLALGGALTGVAVAGDDLDPVGTVTSLASPVTSVASDITGQTTVVSDATDGATGSGAGSGVAGSVDGAISGVTGAVSSTSGTSSGGSTITAGTSSTGGSSPTTDSARTGQSSNDRRSRANGSAQTRFDRLPHRYEVLLERIEFGHKVRASLARLRALFASASPELRSRILRLIRTEIRRLERAGLAEGERARARRLRHLLSDLAGHSSPSTPTAASASLARVALADAGVPSVTAGEPGKTSAGSARSDAAHPTAEAPFTGGPIPGSADVPEVPNPPPAPLDGNSWLWIVFSILTAVALVAVLRELGVRWPKGRS